MSKKPIVEFFDDEDEEEDNYVSVEKNRSSTFESQGSSSSSSTPYNNDDEDFDDEEETYIRPSMATIQSSVSKPSESPPAQKVEPRVDTQTCFRCLQKVDTQKHTFCQFSGCTHKLHVPICYMDTYSSSGGRCPACVDVQWRTNGNHQLDLLVTGMSQFDINLLQPELCRVKPSEELSNLPSNIQSLLFGFSLNRNDHIIDSTEEMAMNYDTNRIHRNSNSLADRIESSNSTSSSSRRDSSNQDVSVSSSRTARELRSSMISNLREDITEPGPGDVLQLTNRQLPAPIRHRVPYDMDSMAEELKLFAAANKLNKPETMGIGLANLITETNSAIISELFENSDPATVVEALQYAGITFSVLKQQIILVYPQLKRTRKDKKTNRTFLDKLIEFKGINLPMLVDIGATWKELVEVGLKWEHVQKRPKFLIRMAKNDNVTINTILTDLCGFNDDIFAAYRLFFSAKFNCKILKSLGFNFMTMIKIHRFVDMSIFKYIPLPDLVKVLGLNVDIIGMLPNGEVDNYKFYTSVMGWSTEDANKYLGLAFMIPSEQSNARVIRGKNQV